MKIAADWVCPVTSPPLYRHAIEIERGIIREIRPWQEGDPYLQGTCLLPGLVNAHTHLAYTGLRNLFDDLEFFPWIRKLTEMKYQKMSEPDIVASTRLGILECLRAGITTVADMCDFECALKTLSESPLRGVFYVEVFGIELDRAQKSWDDLQREYPRLRETYENEKLCVGVSPHACYTVRPELYRWIADWAVRENIPISFHLAESKAEEEFIGNRSGVIHRFLQQRAPDWEILGTTSVTHVEKTGILQSKPLLAHLVQVTPVDIDILHHYDIAVAYCPKSNAKFGHGIAPLVEFDRKGFRIGIGSDSAASNNRFDLFEEARFALLQQRLRSGELAINEQRMLELLTIEGARALQLQDRVGSLEAGKEADMIAVTMPSYYVNHIQVLNHLIHNTTAADVAKTFIAGKEISLPDVPDEMKELYRKLSSSD